jgi:hypothetical protein
MNKEILKPKKVLSCSIDLEYEVMNILDEIDEFNELDYTMNHIFDD